MSDTQRIYDLIFEMKGDMATRSDVSELRSEFSDLKGDVTDIKTDIASLKTTLPQQQTEIRGLAHRVDDLSAQVSSIHTKDLPEIRQQMALDNWFRSNRNKVLAAIAVALMGIAGSVAGSLLLEKLQKDPPSLSTPEMVSPANASTPKAKAPHP